MTRQANTSRSDGAEFLSGGGGMADLIAATDWSATPLGPIDAWPQSLRTTVSLCLASNFPINIIWGPEHCQIYNDGYRVVCGEVHPQALGEAYTKTWASAWPAIGEPFHRALAGETSFLENQRMFLFRNGYLEETFFTFSLSPIRDESGGIGGLFHPVTETTASMLAERRTRLLRDLNARLGDARTTPAVYERALETFREGALDLATVVLYAHDLETGGYRLAGASGMQAGSDSPDLLGLDDMIPWPVARLRDTREPIQVEHVAHLLRGGPYEESPHTALVFPIGGPGQALPVALMIVGVSPRLPLDEPYRSFCGLVASALSAGLANARTYEEERQRAEMLAALDLAKTQFFSNVSHEFRTPLTLMLGPLEDALGETADLPGPHREHLVVAHRNALRLLKLVNSLLEFSRIEAGRTEVNFEATDLAGFTAELASNFRSACERAGLKLVVDCPPLAEPIYVDRNMWEKVVLNLLSNAFKFTLEGEITVTLRLRDDDIELTVRDTGVGIAEDEAPRVFERFHRIEGQGGRTHEGTGIGLALVEELVRLHGGAVRVESRLGEGSAFHATLPRGSAHLEAARVSSVRALEPTVIHADAYLAEALRWLPDQDSEPTRPSPHPTNGRPRVLLADDNADMRAYVRRLLEEGGYEVEAVGDGQAALEAVRRGPVPDLVLSDVMMPRLDGFGLLAALRNDPSLEGLLVILLSARAGEAAQVEGLAAGADDYLVKPFSARELRARVDGALRLARQRREAAQREEGMRAEVDAARNRATLRQTEEQLEFALRAGRMGSWELDLVSGRIVASEVTRDLFGLGPAEPLESYSDIEAQIHPEDRSRRLAAIDEAVATGTDFEIEYRVVDADGGVRWLEARGRAAYADGGAVRLAGVTQDITERKSVEDRQRLLMRELDHRVKNTLATVQSIIMQTRRSTQDPADFDDALIARVQALARAHELLTEASWAGASLADVIARTLATHVTGDDAARVSAKGPAIRLGPNAAVTLNMAFHELATNAVKYGALFTATGRVDVTWETQEVDGAAILFLTWRESGGPPVRTPERRGFGSRLIEQGVPRELFGEAALVFEPDGLVCRLRLPLTTKLALA